MDQFLIHSFANLKTPIELNLNDLQDFIWSFGGGQDRFRKAGINGNLFSVTLNGKRHFACFSEFERDNFLSELYIYLEDKGLIKNGEIINDSERVNDINNLPVLFKDDILIPGNTDYKKIYENINSYITEIRNVLEVCIDGGVPYQYINKYFLRAKELDCFSMYWRQWDSRVGLDQDITDGLDLDINDFVGIVGVLGPSITITDTKLEYSKKCLNCGTYYQEKGAKAVFCSEACRSSYRRKMKKEKARPSTS